MDKYIWLFPVIFIFHDMEEVIGIENWLHENYSTIVRRFPPADRILKAYSGVTTAGFALAVYEELLVLIGVSLLADLTECRFILGLWFGGLIGFTFHLVIHLAQAVYIRRYIPALITSIIALPPGILLIWKSYPMIRINAMSAIGIICGVIGLAVNLKFAHRLMRKLRKDNKVNP